MQIPLPLPVTVREIRAGMNKEGSRQLHHILLAAAWSCIYSGRVASKLPRLFKNSLVRGSPFLHHQVRPTAATNVALRLKPQIDIPSPVQPCPLFYFSLCFLLAVRAAGRAIGANTSYLLPAKRSQVSKDLFICSVTWLILV